MVNHRRTRVAPATAASPRSCAPLANRSTGTPQSAATDRRRQADHQPVSTRLRHHGTYDRPRSTSDNTHGATHDMDRQVVRRGNSMAVVITRCLRALTDPVVDIARCCPCSCGPHRRFETDTTNKTITDRLRPLD